MHLGPTCTTQAQPTPAPSPISVHRGRAGRAALVHGSDGRVSSIRRLPAWLWSSLHLSGTLAPFPPFPCAAFLLSYARRTPSSPWPSSIPWPLPSPSPRIAPGAPPASAASSTLKNTSRVPLLRPDRVVPLLCTANAIAGIRRLSAFPEHTMHTYRLTVSGRIASPSLRPLTVSATAAFAAPEHLAADELMAVAIAAVTLA